DPRADTAQRDGTPDAQAAVPDLDRVQRIPALTEVPVRVGDHVVEPAADQAERHRPHGDVDDETGAAAARLPAPLAPPDGDDDADDDAQRVGADRDRADFPHSARRAGNL